MNIQCPHCHNPIEVVERPPPREVICTVCGSSINLDPGRTFTLAPVEGRRRINRFELLEVVGVGAHGTVYKARDTQLDRIVAVKVPRVSALPSQEDVDRFLRESRSTAQLKHPSIVSLYDAGQVDGTCYLVSEFVHGATLAERLTSGRLTLRQAAKLVAEIADALHYAHQQGVVHRDIKPSNIMLDLDDRPHLMDFGLAKRDAGEITMTIDGQVLGTPAYMSPEQARGEAHRVDPRSDVYSLGVILYELLTGELPFRGHTRMLLVQVVRDEPRPPRRLNDRIPRDLETVCLKAMAKEPGRRYPSAAHLADDLRRWLRGESVHARPVSAAAKAWRWCQRNPTVATLSATVAVLLIATAIGASLAALHLGRLADSERVLREQEAAERTRAEDLAKRNRLALYAARVNLAQQAWEMADVAHAIELLQSQIPGPDEEDLRGFEWYYLWQLCHGERLTIPVDNKAVRGVAVSPDGQWLAAAAGTAIHLYDVASGQPQGTLSTDDEVRALAISPDGRWLAAGAGDVGQGGTVAVWELPARKLRATLDDFDDPVLAIAFSPDGKTLATGTTSLAPGWGNPLTRLIWAQSSAKTEQVQLWDVETASAMRTCSGSTNGILALAFSPDGKTLAAGGWDAAVRLWDTATGELQATHNAFSSYVWSVAFAPDGELVAGGGKWDGRPELKSGLKDELGVSLPNTHTAGITCIAFSPDGQMVATASWDRTIQLRDVATGEQLDTFKGHTSYVASVAFTPDGEYLVTGSWDGKVKLWYTSAPLDHTTLAGWEVGGYSVSFHPTRSLLATASRDSVSVWDLQDGEVQVSLPGHSQTVVAFAPDGQTLATSGIDRIVRVYDTSTWRQLRTLVGHAGTVWAIAHSPDARLLATGSQDTTAKLWDVATGQELAALDAGLGGTVRSVAFSPDGKSLAAAVHIGTAERSKILVWNVESRQEIIALDAHQHYIECVAFSPNGKTLATSSHDTTAILWDTATWHPRATLKGHVEAIYHLTFSPDGKTLATAGWDGVIGLWNIATGQRVATLKGHSGTVWNVAFSQDGKMLSSASSYQFASQDSYRRIHGVKLWHAATDDDVRRHRSFLSGIENSEAAAAPQVAVHRVPPPQHQFADLQALYHQRQWRELAQAAEEASQVLTSNKTVYQYLGEACFRLNDHARAVAAFERHLELCPNCRFALGRLASCRSALGDHTGVVEIMEQLLEQDADSPDAYNRLAWLYVAGPEEVRNPQRAIELSRKALELAPGHPSYLNTLGVAYYRAGSYDQARATLLQSAQANPEGATAFDLFFIAMSCQQLGDHENALAYYDQANDWWKERSDLPAHWRDELRAFRAEAAIVLGLAPQESEG